MSLVTWLTPEIRARLTQTLDLAEGVFAPTVGAPLVWLDGAGANQANALWCDTRTD